MRTNTLNRMNITAFHAKYFAHDLTRRCASDSVEKLASVLSDAQVDLNPHQIEAALFADSHHFTQSEFQTLKINLVALGADLGKEPQKFLLLVFSDVVGAQVKFLGFVHSLSSSPLIFLKSRSVRYAHDHCCVKRALVCDRPQLHLDSES